MSMLQTYLRELRELMERQEQPEPKPYTGLTEEQVAAVDEQVEAA